MLEFNEEGELHLEIPLLDAQDRCDYPNCGAQARAVIITFTGQLLFCMHHTEENEKTIRKDAIMIDKQYDELFNKGE